MVEIATAVLMVVVQKIPWSEICPKRLQHLLHPQRKILSYNSDIKTEYRANKRVKVLALSLVFDITTNTLLPKNTSHLN
jgi:hypothetical protein